MYNRVPLRPIPHPITTEHVGLMCTVNGFVVVHVRPMSIPFGSIRLTHSFLSSLRTHREPVMAYTFYDSNYCIDKFATDSGLNECGPSRSGFQSFIFISSPTRHLYVYLTVLKRLKVRLWFLFI